MRVTLPFFSAIFILFFSASCNNSKISGPATGSSKDSDVISVMSYNIHHANPPSKPNVIDLNAIAKVINKQKPDLVALQEVDVHTNRSGIKLHEAENLRGLQVLQRISEKQLTMMAVNMALLFFQNSP
jgi:hypothetical protein